MTPTLEVAPAKPVVKPEGDSSLPVPTEPLPEEKAETIEEGAIDAYMDEETAPADFRPSTDDWKVYLQTRYEEIRLAYKALLMHVREAELGKRDDLLANLRPQFNHNYRSRKLIVRELRKAGEIITDPFVAQ